MKSSKLPKIFLFMGYYFDGSVRLYRWFMPSGKVRCYLIPSNASLFDYKKFRISSHYAAFLIANCDKI